MANKLIEELLIKVKQQGAKPTEKAIQGVADALDGAKKAGNAFNSSMDQLPKKLGRVEQAAERAASKLSKVQLNFSSKATESSLSNIEAGIEALVSESLDLNQTMGTMSKNLITLFENLATSLGADLNRVEDGLIDVRAEAGKTNDALVEVGKGAKKAGRGIANQNRQGRNQVRTFSDIAKFAGPLPLLYANIAANVFALSEAFRLISEGEQLNRLEEVGKIIGAQIGTPVQFVAQRMQELTGYTISYGEALRNASAAASYGFDTDQIDKLTQAARRASIALGVDMQDAMNRVIRGVSKLEIELLDELGITTKLTTAYQKYAQQIGVSADSLNSYQQRAALVNEVNSQSVEKFGQLDDMISDGAPWERFGANAASAFQTLLKGLATSTAGIATFFNEWAFGEESIKKANTQAQVLGDTLEKAFEQKSRAGIIGGLVEARDLTTKFQKELSVALEEFASSPRDDKLSKRIGYLRSAITTLKSVTDKYTASDVKNLDKANTAYKNLTAVVRGTVQSYNTSIAGIRGQATAYEKLYTDVRSLQAAYELLKKTDPNFDKEKTLKSLGFETEAELNRATRLAEVYRNTSRALAQLDSVQAESAIQQRYKGVTPEVIKLQAMEEEQRLLTQLIVDQKRLGANETVQSQTSAKIYKLQSQILDTRVAIIDARIKEKDLQTQLNMAGQPELLIKRDLLSNEKARLANLQTISGTQLEQQASLNKIKQLENEILAIQVAQSNTMYQSALSNLSSFAPGIDQMTGSLNALAMSFNNMGQSSFTATQMVSSGLQAFQGYLAYSSNQAIQAVDAQIAAEQKRDGKSKESMAKIAALEKKKVEQQKKVAKQQILISTAVAVMNAAANPWPVPAIPLMATAALAGGLAYQQASSASGNLVSGATESTQASLSIGDRANNVDVSQAATRGELAYIRNESGSGSIQSFTPRANGGIGTPGNSIVVGEHGPEVVTPLEPIQAFSAEESRAMGRGGYTDNRQLVVQALDTQSILDRADDIFDAWDASAEQRGYSKEKLG